MPKIHSKYDLPPSPSIEFKNPSMTQPQFKEECDINNIIRQSQRTGFLVDPLLAVSRMPSYGDFSQTLDFHSAQTLLVQSQEAFLLLPADMRKRFNNNPAELLSFLEDENNREEAIRLGILEKPSVSDPVTVVNPGDGQTAT